MLGQVANGGIRMRSVYSAICLLLFSFAAHAIPVRWELPPAVAGTGTGTGTGIAAINESYNLLRLDFTLEGSFVYDADTNVYSDIKIKPSGSSFIYTQTDCYYSCSDQAGLSFGFVGPRAVDSGLRAESHFRLLFDGPLTNAGGAVSLMGGSSLSGGSKYRICDSLEGCGGLADHYGPMIMQGGATIVGTVVPIPAAVWLFGSALAALGFSWRRAIAP